VAHVEYDPRYLAGIRCFNNRAFFEAHEVWEHLWRDEQGPSRRYYQGLIQIAVCLHHFGKGNTRGAWKLYHSSRDYLEAYRPRHLGLDLDRLLADLEQCCAELVRGPADFPRGILRVDLIPRISVDPLGGERP
jgi:uncharacterized protein